MEWTPEQQQEIDKMLVDAKSKWVTDELAPLQAQVTELQQYKPKEKSDAEKALEQKEMELFNKEKNLILREKGLQDFADFLNVTDTEQLNKDIEKLNKVLEAKKLNNTYVPDGHKSADAYNKAEKQGDTITMIGTKLSKLFK
jgi:hypothetical protein